MQTRWVDLVLVPFALVTHTHEWAEILNVPAETDPTVDFSVKDGVTWEEIPDRPLQLDNGEINWSDIPDRPLSLDDGGQLE